MFKNTLQKGSVRYIVFKEEDTWYAVGLEFNIVEEADDPQVALFNLFEAIKGYLKSFAKAHARTHMLNQTAPAEYEDLWNKLTTKQPIPSPYSVDTFGEKQLTHA